MTSVSPSTLIDGEVRKQRELDVVDDEVADAGRDAKRRRLARMRQRQAASEFDHARFGIGELAARARIHRDVQVAVIRGRLEVRLWRRRLALRRRVVLRYDR